MADENDKDDIVDMDDFQDEIDHEDARDAIEQATRARHSAESVGNLVVKIKHDLNEQTMGLADLMERYANDLREAATQAFQISQHEDERRARRQGH